MYLSFYKLSEKPFNISTDPRFLWCGEKHQEALANLKYGLLEANGYVVLTGDVGTGKTTLVNALIETLNENVLVAKINHPTLDTVEFFNLVAKTYDASAEITSKTDFLFFFNSFLQKSYAEGKVVLLVIDEAHRLSKELLEEIRLLSNMEQSGIKLINIFFVGQNELKDVVLCPQCRALRQRITLFYDIEPLSEDETMAYVCHRLSVAGTSEPLFTPAAIHEIHNFTKGYPRLINILCDRALLTGFVKEQIKIDADIVVECTREISFLDPKASTILTNQIDRFSSWGRPLMDRLRAQTTAFKDKHSRGEETLENISLMAKNIKDTARQMAGPFVMRNRRKLIPIGLAGLIALIAVAVGIGMHTEPRNPKEASTELDRTVADKEVDVPIRQDAPAVSQIPHNSTQPVSDRPTPEVAKEASQTLKQDLVMKPEKENTVAKPATVTATALPSEKSPVPDSAPRAGQQSAPPQTAEIVEVDPPKLPQPTTFELASTALEQNNFQTAIDLIEADRSRDTESYLMAREIYSRALVGRADQVLATSPAEAETLLRKAIEVNSKNIDAHFNLGKIYTRSKDYALAIDAYQDAVTLNPKLSDAFFNLGFIYATTGMYEDAEKLYTRVIQLEPTYLDKALFNLAVIQEKLGKKEECLANLQMAVMIKPENQKAQSYLEQLLGVVEEPR